MAMGMASSPEQPGAAHDAWRTAVAALLGFGLLIAYVGFHRTRLLPNESFGVPGAFRADAAIAVLHACAGLLFINMAAWGLATPLRRLFPAEDGPLIVPIRLGLGLLLVAHGVLLLAAFHLLVPAAMAALLAVPSAFCLIAAWPGRLRAEGSRRSWPLSAVLWPCGLLVVASLPQAFVPVYGWDALTYHLAVPERYLFHNEIYMSRFSVFGAFPLAVEMLYTIALALHGPALAKLIHLELGVLVLWAAVAIGSSRSWRGGRLAAALLLADPLFLWETTVAYNDLALALYALLATQALVDFRGRRDAASLVRCGLFAGGCVATRYPGALVPLCLATVLAFDARRRGARATLRAIAVIFGLTLLVASPWLARNAVLTGNPVAPLFQGLVQPGAEYFDPVAIEQQIAFSRSIGMGRGLGSLLLLPWNVTMRSVAGLYGGSFGFRVGPLYPIALVAVLLVPAARRSAFARLAMPVTGALALSWWATTQEARYLLPALALLAVAGGEAVDELASRAPRVGHALLAVVALGLALAQWPAWHDSVRTVRRVLGADPRDGPPEHANAVGDALRSTMRA
ncbi:MAG TPA: hypothetical protein VEQ84_14595, partial [Vicinamibacteria bacterium]|nr:hypothetical protein [Vicinamibacteria bacterium]